MIGYSNPTVLCELLVVLGHLGQGLLQLHLLGPRRLRLLLECAHLFDMFLCCTPYLNCCALSWRLIFGKCINYVSNICQHVVVFVSNICQMRHLFDVLVEYVSDF